ncbi:hypothetical protein [Mycoplasma sp. 1654_15]|uniref:hypothetical protein n=1 Tax=Mycoplasma sp. 1654_15 TaxID=2725994 RepID=UPI001599F937|nr:hypothetical protein [Mycoplasma sp. 1654_15]QKG28168.1 hypothetical protein HF996_01565 [Mycoplasma sp. 1654_15]
MLLFTKEEKIKQNILQKHKQQAQIIIKQFLKTLDSLDYEIRYKNQANKHWNNKQIKLITKAKQISSLKQK